jgi:hypothetical protein
VGARHEAVPAWREPRRGERNIGLRLVKIAAVYMLIGLVMGLAMGISGNLTLMSVHSHILLLGWATMAVAGIAYGLMPGCHRSPLTKWHFWGRNLGLPVMMGSLALKDYGLSAADFEGLRALDRAWRGRVPFDNVRKMIALRGNSTAVLPGDRAEQFLEDWLSGGTGGTRWPPGNALFELVRSIGFQARRRRALSPDDVCQTLHNDIGLSGISGTGYET